MKTSINILDNKNRYEQFFKENYSPLCRFAFSFLKDADDAEEIVQNSFVKLWKEKDQITVKTSLKSYLYTAVRNSCLNELKHIDIKETYKQHNKIELNRSTSLENEIEANELQEQINIAIEKMPEQRRKIFKMSRFEGLKYKEIAKKLEISPKTVENHMGLAMKFLREELKDYLHILFVLFFIEGLGDMFF